MSDEADRQLDLLAATLLDAGHASIARGWATWTTAQADSGRSLAAVPAQKPQQQLGELLVVEVAVPRHHVVLVDAEHLSG